MILDIIIFVFIFLIGSLGSTKLLSLYGYHIPKNIKSREDWIVFGMKLVLFALLVVVQFIILLLIGYTPGGG